MLLWVRQCATVVEPRLGPVRRVSPFPGGSPTPGRVWCFHWAPRWPQYSAYRPGAHQLPTWEFVPPSRLPHQHQCWTLMPPSYPRGAHCSPSYVLMAWQRRSFAEPPCSMGTFTLSYGIAGRWPGLTLVSSPLLYFLTLPRSLFHLLWPGPSHPDAGPGGCPGRSSS